MAFRKNGDATHLGQVPAPAQTAPEAASPASPSPEQHTATIPAPTTLVSTPVLGK